MNRIFFSILAIFFLSNSFLISRAQVAAGMMPSLLIRKTLTNEWNLNFKWESRHFIMEDLFSDESTFNYDYLFSDFSFLVSRKVGVRKSLTAGYMIRYGDRVLKQMALQQFNLIHPFKTFILAQRFAGDQSFYENEPVEVKLRYRIAAELPLSGRSVDANEFYVKISNEYLNHFQGGDYKLEARIFPAIGFTFTGSNKLELGVDYRISTILEANPSKTAWLHLNWFIRI